MGVPMIAPQGQVTVRAWGGSVLDKRLWYLLAGTRGGLNRGRILKTLRERPLNANDLSGRLGLDYKTVRHHLDVLRENDCVMTLGSEGYGLLYTLSPRLQSHFEDFEAIWRRLESHGELGKEQNRMGSIETA
jgi:DNA-binding transcriptional ArsR family regulator